MPESRASGGASSASSTPQATPRKAAAEVQAEGFSLGHVSVAWCLGILIFLFLVGGAVFSWLERDAELAEYERNKAFYEEARRLYEFNKCDRPIFQNMALCKNQEAFASQLAKFFERTGNLMHDTGKWTLFGSAFYVGTLVTTLGYGSHHPLTPGGQLFTVVFGMIGIPLMGYVLSCFGTLMVESVIRRLPHMRHHSYSAAALGGFCILLICIGGFAFNELEGWGFLACSYFASVTLTTVGFGDLAPTSDWSRTVSLIFMLLGLGVMASFLALLQVAVEEEGEHFAKRVTKIYRATIYSEPWDTPRLPLVGSPRAAAALPRAGASGGTGASGGVAATPRSRLISKDPSATAAAPVTHMPAATTPALAEAPAVSALAAVPEAAETLAAPAAPAAPATPTST